VAAAGSSASGSGSATDRTGKDLWQAEGSAPALSPTGTKPDLKIADPETYTLDDGGLAGLLGRVPDAPEVGAGSARTLTVSLPDPNGKFQRFAIHQSDLMAPALAAKHPEIQTFSGRGLDDPAATIHADMSPIGFHASVRSTTGTWYVDPYFQRDDSLYTSYYGRSVQSAPGQFVERDASSAELGLDKGYYPAADDVTLSGDGFKADADVTITISDPEDKFASRTLSAHANGGGSFTRTFTADPDGHLETHIVEASSGDASASTSYQVVRDDDPTVDPPTGDVLRTYRLALITDPGYAAFHGGPANVTAAKVALINRVDQVYEDDLSIHLQFVGNNDLLNFNTWDQAIGPNGPCGAAACFTQSQVTGCSGLARNRVVIGQIIGASNYDIGHLALGQPGGGVANLGVIGRAAKAQGCTGIPTPTGDFYAIDYVAHEMGHQFSGNHPFNGTQLNCSGGNRNASTSTEPGSGSSVMAYAGICLTDDLQAHSDPYFSQRSQQEISTYTSSNQNPINEVQEIALRHFGGGNEQQVATFGPGFAPTATIQPLTVAIGAVPSATQLGGAQEIGNTVTISTGAAGATHTLQPGDSVTIAGVANPGYNGTFTVATVPGTRAFTYNNPNAANLPVSGGGTITLNQPGLTESGNTVTVSTVAAHGRSVGDVVTISGAGNAGYNGNWTITAVPTPRTFQFTNPTAGLPASGAGTMTFISPFKLRINGNDSPLINSANYTNAGLTAAFAAIPSFSGTATATGAATTGFTVTYTGASANADVPNFSIQGLSCGGCFASVEETNHGGATDSFTLSYNGNTSAPIVNGTNYTAAGLLAALTPILPAGTTPTLQAFGGGNINGLNNQGFAVSFGGGLAATNVPFMLQVTNTSAGMNGFVNELDKGGAVDNKGIVTPTGDAIPVVTAPAQYTIPLRTPFTLTGSATDADGDSLLYSWEQNDRGSGTGTTLLNNAKTNGPLFAVFPKSGQISLSDALMYHSPGENHLTGDPSRTFPDLQQILDNNTNADTGTCPGIAPIAPPVPQSVTECFAEFLPTSDYVGFAGTNASPLSLHFRLTARDLKGGTSSGDTTVLLASATGPFLVTSPNTAAPLKGASTPTVTWNVAGTDAAPINTANVKISLSTDGGHTYPTVLAASTPNDGSQAVTLPNIATTQARVKVEAVDNVFFDVSNANFAIQALPVVTDNSGGSRTMQYSDSILPALTVSASDADTPGSGLTAAATGLPAGLSLAVTATSSGATLPGTRTWTVTGTTTAAPASYPVTVNVTDADGGQGTTSFTIVVAPEDADATYTGDELVFLAPNATSASVELRATVRDSSLFSSDAEPGDIRTATVTFKEGTTTLCGPLPVSLTGGALTTGSASCTVTLAAGDHDIDIVVGGNYTASGDAAVFVAASDGSFVHGDGHFDAGSTAGTYAADAASKIEFNFDIKYKKPPKAKPGEPLVVSDLDGNVKIKYSIGKSKYEIEAKEKGQLKSLGIASKTPAGAVCTSKPSTTCLGLADLRANATLTDTTKKKVVIGSNLSLRITATDRGGGKKDTIGITVWDGSTLVFSSDWTGADTVERTIDGGDIPVH
jgi:hypothetical protein